MAFPTAVGELHERHKWLIVACTLCERRSVLPLAQYVIWAGPQLSIDWLRSHLRCSKCRCARPALLTPPPLELPAPTAPGPWRVGVAGESYSVEDATGRSLAWIYYDDDPARRMHNRRLTSKDANDLAHLIAREFGGGG